MATHTSVLGWRISGTGSLVGCCLWGRTESDTTEATQLQHQQRQTQSLKKLLEGLEDKRHKINYSFNEKLRDAHRKKM